MVAIGEICTKCTNAVTSMGQSAIQTVGGWTGVTKVGAAALALTSTASAASACLTRRSAREVELRDAILSEGAWTNGGSRGRPRSLIEYRDWVNGLPQASSLSELKSAIGGAAATLEPGAAQRNELLRAKLTELGQTEAHQAQVTAITGLLDADNPRPTIDLLGEAITAFGEEAMGEELCNLRNLNEAEVAAQATFHNNRVEARKDGSPTLLGSLIAAMREIPADSAFAQRVRSMNEEGDDVSSIAKFGRTLSVYRWSVLSGVAAAAIATALVVRNWILPQMQPAVVAPVVPAPEVPVVVSPSPSLEVKA